MATAQTLSAVADPLAALCVQDATVRARVGEACNTAAEAVTSAPQIVAAARDGRDGAAGTDGIDGLNGKDGVGITSSAIVGGRLVLTYSDGSAKDVGQVVGPAGAVGATGATGAAGQNGAPGADGAPGAPGRDGSPAASYISTYPDGSSMTCTRSGGEDTMPTYTCVVS